MIGFIIRRLLYGLTVLWGVVTLVFFIFNLKPGDPAQMLLGQRATPEAIAAVQRDLGYDLPLFKRYGLYLNDLSPISIHEAVDDKSRIYYDKASYGGLSLFDIGSRVLVAKAPYLRRSYQSKREVGSIIWEAFPGTFVLAVSAITFALILGMAIGVLSAVWKDSFFDRSALVVSVLGMSAPSFYMAIIISWIGGFLWYETVKLPILPFVFMVFAVLLIFFKKGEKGKGTFFSAAGKGLLIGLGVWVGAAIIEMLFAVQVLPFSDSFLRLPGTYLSQAGSLYDIDVFEGKYLAPRNLILPMITLGIRPLAVVSQLMRNSLLEELSQDYVRTAKAKGLSQTRVVMGHAFRNALNPLVTAISGWFASMLAGAVFIEFIFGWQGLGLRIYEALIKEDFPMVIGSVIVISTIFVVINILVDILYGLLDPRIRVGG